MIIIHEMKFNTTEELQSAFFDLYDDYLATKDPVEIEIDKMKDPWYGCTPFFLEAEQMFETKYGRTYHEMWCELNTDKLNTDLNAAKLNQNQ